MSEDCQFCRYEKAEENCRGCFEGSHYRPKPITNADRIRAMTDEELVAFLSDYICATCGEGAEARVAMLQNNLLDWLKQECEK